MLQLMVDWKNDGGSRLDSDDDGKIDAPGAAVMDGSWTNIANAFMQPRLGTDLSDELNTLFSRFDKPPGGQYSGWYQYFDRDINALLGKNVPSPFHLSYCGKGDLEKCQQDIWDAIDASGDQIAVDQGTERPGAVAFERDGRADQLLAAAAEDDAVHEPPERDPAGHRVRRPPQEQVTEVILTP